MISATSRRLALPAATWTLLAAWGAFCFLYGLRNSGEAWHFFVQGGHLFTQGGPKGGLHLYATAPQLQIGPLALAVGAALLPFGTAGSMLAAQILAMMCGALVLVLVRDIARLRPEATAGRTAATQMRVFALAAALFLPTWAYMAVFSVHLDDALALTFGVVGVHLCVTGRAAWAGLSLGLAVDAKPWALPFARIVLILPGIRAKGIAVAALAGAVAVGWLPFLLADPQTMKALHFTIRTTGMSALHELGVTAPRTPWWDRSAQGALGLLVGTLAVRNRRWALVILAPVAVRLVLDPGTNRYYLAGLLTGTLLWDVAGRRSRWPYWTIAGFVGLFVLRWAPMPAAYHGWLTLVYTAAVVFAAVVPGLPGPVAERLGLGPQPAPAPAAGAVRRGNARQLAGEPGQGQAGGRFRRVLGQAAPGE